MICILASGVDGGDIKPAQFFSFMLLTFPTFPKDGGDTIEGGDKTVGECILGIEDDELSARNGCDVGDIKNVDDASEGDTAVGVDG